MRGERKGGVEERGEGGTNIISRSCNDFIPGSLKKQTDTAALHGHRGMLNQNKYISIIYDL